MFLLTVADWFLDHTVLRPGLLDTETDTNTVHVLGVQEVLLNPNTASKCSVESQ